MSIEFSSSPDKIVVDRRRKRSDTSNTIRKVRSEFTSGSTYPVEYELELIENFARSHLNASWVMPLFVFMIALVSYKTIGAMASGFWFFTIALSYLLLSYQSGKFLKQNDRTEVVSSWRFRFLLNQFLLGVCWSIFALGGITAALQSTNTIIQFSTILVLQAGTAMLSIGLRHSVLIVCAPPTLILATRFLLPSSPSMMLMGVILLVSLGFFYLLAGRFKYSVLTEMKHKGENETLIAELETAQAISEEARRRAEEANLAKSRFLATMSHELRTPLNAILGFSEIMKNEALGPMQNETYKEYAADIYTSGDHLLNVINEILDLSRIEAGRQNLTESVCSLSDIVEEAKNMTMVKAKGKAIRISVNIEPQLPKIWVDERAVRQITLNLLSNAVKFTPTGGAIDIKVGWTSSGGQYICVIDDGPGIPEEEIPIVLSTFGQGSIAIKSAEKGSGLGLPIVQALMHMHEGRLELFSKLREGTKVIATFPPRRVLDVSGRIDQLENKDTRPNSDNTRKRVTS
ncbi:MAG: sensor histidine kinase [Hyphomicrobiales bacterium]|nr:sensor histidine kinase [Hyphomicrobiales bacterium]